MRVREPMRLPEPARSIAASATDSVAAARSRDREEFQQAAVRLAALNAEQVGVVLGAVVRSLLEDVHPDGLSGEDVQAVLERCVRSAAGWLPEVDPNVLVALLIGALGVHQPNAHESRVNESDVIASDANEPHANESDGACGPLTSTDVALHAPLLVADLLARSGRGLAGYLDSAFAEIARAETIEMP
jgi:hypothetical protein